MNNNISLKWVEDKPASQAQNGYLLLAITI